MAIKIFMAVLVLVFFNACATPQVMTPEEIDLKAIPPSADNNLFSPPKNGYARLIMYRNYKFVGSGARYDVFVKYNYKPAPKKQQADNTIYDNEFDNIVLDRALCRMGSNSSCIVNIRAGQPLALIYKIDMGALPIFYTPAATLDGQLGYVGAFTPKNQHIYCINMTIHDGNFRQFRDKDTCLKEYQKMYKPKHRKYQEKWLNKLIKEGDKRAYQE